MQPDCRNWLGRISCKVIKVDSADNDVVVATARSLKRRGALKEQRLGVMHEGMEVKGIVRNLLDYMEHSWTSASMACTHVTRKSHALARSNKPSDHFDDRPEIVRSHKVDRNASRSA